MKRRVVAVTLAAATVGGLLTGCEVGSTLSRADAPQVLTGSQLPTMLGVAPSTIVAFAHVQVDGAPVWRQIPVQVDQRKVVGFGSQPANNTTAGVTGTVYGSGSTGVTALQYTDTNTWVGADSDPNFDSDDELVFMSSDAGGVRPDGAPAEPTGVVSGSGVRVDLADPLTPANSGTVYLFRAVGGPSGLSPSAGQDYVDYQFTLTSGPYKTTYKRADGPNPETSRVITDAYEIGYSDRWYEDRWEIADGSGVDILDGNKNQFAVNSCGRSNLTFADAEGAFVANIDGPVRGIRSYIGANSGPLTQRTHFMYRDHEKIATDLRVHDIPQIMDFVDYSAAAIGMKYFSETVPNGVIIDGTADAVGTGLTDWEAVNGAQGSVVTTMEHVTDIAAPGGFETKIDWFHRDQTTPPETQCWGDGSFLGASGTTVTDGVPNTDPRSTPFSSLRVVRTVKFGPPATDADAVAALGTAWSEQVRTALLVTVSPA